MVNKLPAGLLEKMSRTLRECGPFDDPEQLQALFYDQRLQPWLLSSSDYIDAGLNELLTYLFNHPDELPNPLLRFLAVLAEAIPPSSGCRGRLISLIFELAEHLAEDPYLVLDNLAGPLEMLGGPLPEQPPPPMIMPDDVDIPDELPAMRGDDSGTKSAGILPPDENDIKQLRMDVAVPEQVVCGEPFQLAATIREIASPLLAIEALSQVESGDVTLYWPDSNPVIRLRLQVRATNCELDRDEEHIQLFPGARVPVIFFDLIPREVGSVQIRVVLYQEDIWLSSADIETNALEQPAGEVQTRVVSVVPTGPTYVQIRDVLIQCGPVQSDQILANLFTDERLHPWRNFVTDAANVQERAESLIALLRDKENTAGQNGMGLFLQVAADRLDEQDACRQQLNHLAVELLNND